MYQIEKINKDIEDLINAINRLGLLDFYKTQQQLHKIFVQMHMEQMSRGPI